MEKEFDLGQETMEFYEELIEKYSQVKKYKYALHYCNMALKCDPKDVDLLYTRVLILYKDYKFHEALIALELVNKNDVDKLYEKDTEILFYSIRSILLYL
jgi:tetratricopeptide (TPR) repeat protein